MIPASIKISGKAGSGSAGKNGALPDEPGVYFYYDRAGRLLYVGKATSLKRRVGSYFTKAHEARIEEMVAQIARIEYVQTPTVIEALVLEANQIKARKPTYNILQRDDKTYLYLVVTRADFPKPLLMRGLDLERLGVNPFARTLTGAAKRKFLAVFGPYTSGPSLRKALDLVRKAIPWSDCDAPTAKASGVLDTAFSWSGLSPSSAKKQRLRLRPPRPCFNVGLKKCPGVCVGAISKAEYRTIIRQLILFFRGKKTQLLRQLKKEMAGASRAMNFERAARLRNSVYALEHIQDVALITREEASLPFSRPSGIPRPAGLGMTPPPVTDSGVNLDGRIEAYDISNISGTSAVGSMAVFENGQPDKSAYRKFRIKTVQGSNDFAMMEEVLRRRLKHAAWPLPQVMVIDGGEGQVAVVERVLDETFGIPERRAPNAERRPHIVGLAKGFDRKQDRLVHDPADQDLARMLTAGKELFQCARDEAHRFAVSYHRVLRKKRSMGTISA